MRPNFERESARCAREGCGRRILRPPSLEFQFLFSLRTRWFHFCSSSSLAQEQLLPFLFQPPPKFDKVRFFRLFRYPLSRRSIPQRPAH